jgi:formylglycine-generating enzyme required for sulfatase activity
LETTVSAPSALLKDIGKAIHDAVGAELAGDFVVEVLPEVVNNTWTSWSTGRDESQRREEIDALVRATEEEVRETVLGIVKEVAAGQGEGLLADYLTHIPPTIRHWFRRPADPNGATLPDDLPLGRAEDLLPFLPIRLPRFKAGDCPLPGVDWQLVELLGVGGFGEVWKARNPNMSSAVPVALKFCLDPPSTKVLRNEARLLDRLMFQGKHPGIVPLRQTYLSAEPPCLEYEYIPGGDLAGLMHEWHRQRGGLGAAQVSRVVLRLAEIVAFAHRLDPPIVHRDLKPANILVQRTPGGKFALRIADFGNGGVAASHAIRQTLRGTSQAQLLVSAVRGTCTPLYASPQQMRGHDADPRDDVYALGVIWHQLMTGELGTGRPGGTRWPKRLKEQGMAAPLIDLLGSCFEDNADDRPRNAESLAEQIRDLMQGGSLPVAVPVEAPTPASVPAELSLPRRIANSIGMTLTLVPAGSFKMGSPPTETDRGDDEGPAHEVHITRPFYMGIYPVTQRQFEAVMGHNPAYFNSLKGGGPEFPVESISWSEAEEFCRRLSRRPAERAAGRSYRLPTEAEWEYACRAGVQMPFTFGATLSSAEANFNGKYPYGLVLRGPYLERTSKVGSYPPNAFGLFDMHGNVWEWCGDYYDRQYYRNSPNSDPPGPTRGNQRIVRGGSCHQIGKICRSAYRFGIVPTNKDIDVGMRVVMVLNQETFGSNTPK